MYSELFLYFLIRGIKLFQGPMGKPTCNILVFLFKIAAEVIAIKAYNFLH